MLAISKRSTVLLLLLFAVFGCGDGSEPVAQTDHALVWTAQATLVPNDGGGTGAFVELSGDLALLGVPTHLHGGVKSGAVYVFRRSSAGTWQEEQELIPLGAAASDEVGTGVAVDGDRIAIGARSDDGAGSDAGSAFVFEWSGSSWQQTAEILPPDPNTMAWFGNSTALDGDLLAVGAPFYIEGNKLRGAVYVFEWNGTSWNLEQKLLPPADKPMGGFGADLDLDAGTLLVGAPTMSTTGQASGAGRAYAYVRDPATKTWSLQGTFMAASGTIYGNEVELSGDRALISARSGLSPQGIAHVHERIGTSWSAGTELVPQGLTGSDAFGYAIALAGDQAFASAPAGDDFGDKSGRVHVFTNGGGSWAQTETFHSPAPAAGEAFGGSMAGDPTRVLVGTTWDTRAYVFELGAGSGGSGGSAGGGSGGSVAAGGSSGSAGTSSSGGTAGTIGTGGAAGSASGGTGATAAGGSGGSLAFGGAAGTGAQAAAASNDGGGCGCRAPARSSGTSGGWVALLAVLALGRIRRRITA